MFAIFVIGGTPSGVPVFENGAYEPVLGFDGCDEEVAVKIVGSGASADIMDIKIGHRCGDELAVFVDDRIVDECCVNFASHGV